MELKDALKIVLDAFRHYDDENDLARFDTLLDAAIRTIEVVSYNYEQERFLKSIFREVVGDAEEVLLAKTEK